MLYRWLIMPIFNHYSVANLQETRHQDVIFSPFKSYFWKWWCIINDGLSGNHINPPDYCCMNAFRRIKSILSLVFFQETSKWKDLFLGSMQRQLENPIIMENHRKFNFNESYLLKMVNTKVVCNAFYHMLLNITKLFHLSHMRRADNDKIYKAIYTLESLNDTCQILH